MKSILIVEDDAPTAETTGMLLSYLGCKTTILLVVWAVRSSVAFDVKEHLPHTDAGIIDGLDGEWRTVMPLFREAGKPAMLVTGHHDYFEEAGRLGYKSSMKPMSLEDFVKFLDEIHV